VIATVTSPRFGLGLAGALLLASPLLLPRGERVGLLAEHAPDPVGSVSSVG
jgi:hypothetical protein